MQDWTSLNFGGSGWSISHMNKIGVLEGLREKTRTQGWLRELGKEDENWGCLVEDDLKLWV